MKDVFILSDYDAGYYWSIYNGGIETNCEEERDQVYNPIWKKFFEMTNKKFSEYIFSSYPDINVVILCVDGGIELFFRKD